MSEISIDRAMRLPGAALRPFIACYGGYQIDGLPPGIMRGLPSRHVTLMIGLGDGFAIKGAGVRQSFVGGLHDAAAVVERAPTAFGIKLPLTPLGVRTLLGVPAAELASRVFELREVLGFRASELEERLRGEPGWTRRFDILDEVFARDLGEWSAPQELLWAWHKLIAHRGCHRIDALADEIGWSRRHFTQRFDAEFGVTPKTMARIVRFENACAMIKRTRPALAQVAASCGYHDQAHMTREWHALAGCSPRIWIAEELPFVQDYELAALDD